MVQTDGELRKRTLDRQITAGIWPTADGMEESALHFQLNGQAQQFGAGVELQFLLDMFTVGLNGFRTKMQHPGNFTDRFTPSQQLKYFQFPIA